MQNLIRAITARQTVSEYMEPGFGGPDGVRQGLVDLVADLMHLCHEDGINCTEVEQSATGHFKAEIKGFAVTRLLRSKSVRTTDLTAVRTHSPLSTLIDISRSHDATHY